MRSLIVPLTLIFSSAASFASPKVCGLRSGVELKTYQDSVSEIGTGVSPVVATGLADLYSLPDIQGLIASVAPERVCVSAVAVSKNIYQYDRLLVTLDLEQASGGSWVTPILFQTASVQAHENTGPKPWVGFSRQDFAALIRQAVKGLAFEESGEGESFSPVSLGARLFRATASWPIDLSSRSYVFVPGVDPDWSTYVLTQLRVLQTGNPFTSQYLTDAAIVQVQERTGRVRSALLPGFFDLLSRMEALQTDAQPADPSSGARLETLLRLSHS